jgi:hypothetical protein
MSELVDFLRAELDQDEQVASRATYGGGGSEWTQRGSGVVFSDDRDQVVSQSVRPEAILHVVRMDPARVLAEVDAKRRILDWIVRAVQVTEADGYNLGVEDLLRLLALSYADRPGYREESRPDL